MYKRALKEHVPASYEHESKWSFICGNNGLVPKRGSFEHAKHKLELVKGGVPPMYAMKIMACYQGFSYP